MHDFISHHKLPSNLELPHGAMRMNKVFSCILDVMAHSMGEETRKNLIKELEEYKQGLPFDLR
jgi:hypothetical protein